MMSLTNPAERWQAKLSGHRKKLQMPEPVLEGRLTRMVGLTLEAVGCQAAIGSRCQIITKSGDEVEAEVVGFAEEKTFLMPTGDMRGLVPGARVIPTGRQLEVPVGDSLLGRVLDGAGNPLDDKGPLHVDQFQPLSPAPINPLDRVPIDAPLDVGIRSINGLLSVGRGQRMGLFAGSGVGKSELLGMMTRYTEAEVTVVGLIGERGREVQEFVAETLGPEGMARAVVVAVPADNSPLKRLHGAMLATSIAEYFRDQGKDVLLLVDSLTRYAQAQREIALAIGEPPATKGYPPSVFAKLPQLVERAGNGASGGSITAFYTVLAEGDDHNDPVVDSARAVLDGHIVLSRALAESGHYPAIDLEASVSRLMTTIASPEQLELARRFRQLYSKYQQNLDLISVGVYQRGSDPEIDAAIDIWPQLQSFLGQNLREHVNLQESMAQLTQLLDNPVNPPAVT
ncbi:MAG TPA: flagellar protein export ATPase FliI [Chromatiales bacterium]|nr:flagellar protein export ATPase FliI [Thiotrichales bacterium]HIP68532.1 flagellar protein export ATPase FliI [Chromatiales bacterium]